MEFQNSSWNPPLSARGDVLIREIRGDLSNTPQKYLKGGNSPQDALMCLLKCQWFACVGGVDKCPQIWIVITHTGRSKEPVPLQWEWAHSPVVTSGVWRATCRVWTQCQTCNNPLWIFCDVVPSFSVFLHPKHYQLLVLDSFSSLIMEIAVQGGMAEFRLQVEVVFPFSRRNIHSRRGRWHWVFFPTREKTCFPGVPEAKGHAQLFSRSENLRQGVE